MVKKYSWHGINSGRVCFGTPKKKKKVVVGRCVMYTADFVG